MSGDKPIKGSKLKCDGCEDHKDGKRDFCRLMMRPDACGAIDDQEYPSDLPTIPASVRIPLIYAEGRSVVPLSAHTSDARHTALPITRISLDGPASVWPRGMFSVLQHAWNYVSENFDQNGHQLTIEMAEGEYPNAGLKGPAARVPPVICR